MISLTDGTTTIDLPDLVWEGEFDWSPVTQKSGHTVTGALWVHSYARAAGRPIVLHASDKHGWLSRTTLQSIVAMADAAAPTQALVLSIHGTDYNVVFDFDAKAIEAVYVEGYDEPIADDHYIVTLRFLAI
jgi:hypothetical protein